MDEKNHRWILYNNDTYSVPPKIIPIIKKIGLSNLLEKETSKLVKEINKLISNGPNNQGNGKLINIAIIPPRAPNIRAT